MLGSFLGMAKWAFGVNVFKDMREAFFCWKNVDEAFPKKKFATGISLSMPKTLEDLDEDDWVLSIWFDVWG